MVRRLRSLKKGARKAGVAKGLFKRAGAKLKPPKSLPNRGVWMPRYGPPAPGHKAVVRPANIPPNAAPFRPELAERVQPYGRRRKKTDGLIDLGGERVVYQVSGQGPGTSRPVGGGHVLDAHVESHTVARMRRAGVKEATLYINRKPCEFTSGASHHRDGCMIMLQRVLRPGEKVTVYYPPGKVKVFEGK